jgi:hypothetical protein
MLTWYLHLPGLPYIVYIVHTTSPFRIYSLLSLCCKWTTDVAQFPVRLVALLPGGCTRVCLSIIDFCKSSFWPRLLFVPPNDLVGSLLEIRHTA